MMPKVEATKRTKIQSVLQDFHEEFIKCPNDDYIPICAAVRFLATNAFLLKVIEIHTNTKNRLAVNLNYESHKLRRRL